MYGNNHGSWRSFHVLAGVALALAGCTSAAGTPATEAPMLSAPISGPAVSSQGLYIGNIQGGVPIYSTGKNPHEVGDITNGLPRVTDVWVDKKGVLYAFTDNGKYPYETIEEFKRGDQSPFFSLTLERYGSLVAADSKQNVYAQGEAAISGSEQQVIDVYPPGSQKYTDEYVVPSIGKESGVGGMAFDSTGALLVGVVAFATNKQGQVGAAFRLDAGSGMFVNLNLKKDYGGLIALDAAGNLYAGGGTLISVYPPGATKPSRMVHTTSTITSLTAAPDGTLYVDIYNGGISIYPPGEGNPKESFSPDAQVAGLALGPR